MNYTDVNYGLSRAPAGISRLAPPLKLKWSYLGGSTPRVQAERVVTLANQSLVSLDETGHERWIVSAGRHLNFVIQADQVFDVTDDGKFVRIELETGQYTAMPFDGRSVVAFAPDGKTAVTWDYQSENGIAVSRVARCGLPSGTPIVWERIDRSSLEELLVFGSKVAIARGRVFLSKGPARLLCLDYETGETVWDSDLEETRPGMWQPGIAHLEVRGYPMVSNERVLVVTGVGLAAFDVTTGRLVWSHHVHAGSVSPPYGNRVYVITGINFSGYRIIDMETGETVIDRELTDEKGISFKEKRVSLISGLGVTETHVFAGDHLGRLWAFERETGRAVWSHRPKTATSYATAIPVIYGGRLYIAGFSLNPERPQHLYCYEQA